eukprot:6175925-Amphidinium_carterae.1
MARREDTENDGNSTHLAMYCKSGLIRIVCCLTLSIICVHACPAFWSFPSFVTNASHPPHRGNEDLSVAPRLCSF